jgi:hypothetical protein
MILLSYDLILRTGNAAIFGGTASKDAGDPSAEHHLRTFH